MDLAPKDMRARSFRLYLSASRPLAVTVCACRYIHVRGGFYGIMHAMSASMGPMLPCVPTFTRP